MKTNGTSVGALVIGQAPRADLVGPLELLLPDCEVVQAGALDGMNLADIEFADAGSPYPLSTRLADGSLVRIEQAYIADKLQGAIGRLEAQGVGAIVLLCAGTFATLRADSVPLVKPFDAGRQMLTASSYQNIGFITPVAGQERPIEARWMDVGFRPKVWHASLDHQDATFKQTLAQHIADHQLDCIVLDYVGLATSTVATLRGSCPIPVIDLGELALHTVASLITHQADNG